MFVEYNRHPENKKVGDCVKRAISTAESKDYKELQRELNRLKRELGAKDYKRPEVWKTYIKRKKYLKLSFPAEKGKPRMNGYTFTKNYPKGVFILRMAGHLSVCIDGVIYDTFDPREKCIYTAFEVR